jgi:glutamine amidotransferase
MISKTIEIPPSRVLIVDYGMGNLHSVAKAVQHVAGHCHVTVSDDPKALLQADRVILPGVGAMRDCMQALSEAGWESPIKSAWQEKPFLGICVGMQMLLESSQENDGAKGLGLLPGVARHIADHLGSQTGGQVPPKKRLKVPHMGWNQVRQQCTHPLWQGIANDTRFYFVHSYALPVEPGRPSADAIAGTVSYGGEWAAALIKGRVAAVQFHPEKSQQAGLTLLRNFMAWQPQ